MPARGQDQRLSRVQKATIVALEEAQLNYLKWVDRTGGTYKGAWLSELNRAIAKTGVKGNKPGALKGNFRRSVSNLVGKPLPDGRQVVWGGPYTVCMVDSSGELWAGRP